MRLRRREAPQLGVLGAVALAATLLSVAAGAGGAQHDATRVSASAWRGLVGTPRQQVAVGQRVIVVLKNPSLADRVASVGGKATEAQQRQWTAAALAAGFEPISATVAALAAGFAAGATTAMSFRCVPPQT